MKIEKIAIIATAPHTFHGAGTIKHRVLRTLKGLGYDVHFVGLGRPFFFKTHSEGSFAVHIAQAPQSEAYAEHGKLYWSTYSIAEEVANLAIRKLKDGKNVLLWGTYLFPFVQSLCLANDYIEQAWQTRLPILSFPAGSDIWESGPQLKRSVRWLLDSPQISARATYSNRFVREIKRRFGIQQKFHVLPPLLDRSEFRKLSPTERNAAQRNAGVPEGVVVIMHHSNLRPVKRVQDTIDMVERAASSSKKEVLLVVVGPYSECNAFQHEQYRLLGTLRPSVRKKNMIIVYAGLQADVRPYLDISDIAINTSVHDSFNVSLLEAAWSGVTCVTTRAPAISDYFKAGRCAKLIEFRPGMRFLDTDSLIALEESPFDLDDGARNLLSLIDCQRTRVQLADNADVFLTKYLDPTIVLRKYEDVIHLLMEQ